MNQIDELRAEINRHSYLYYVKDSPIIDDYQFDQLMNRLINLEREHPELITPDSPTQRVLGQPLEAFQPASHASPLLSLNNAFSPQDVIDFGNRVRESLNEDTIEYSVEPKIDGLSVSLTYEEGIFIRGATRGDGTIGEDVTHQLRTIRQIPLTLKEKRSLTVRGEVFMSLSVFEQLNRQRQEQGQELFKNPRNAAAGGLRQLNPQLTSARRLSIFVFNVEQGADTGSHVGNIELLNYLGFNTIPCYGPFGDIAQALEKVLEIGQKRESFAYDIDGAVIKINSTAQRSKLGQTQKSPRWAVAYKFPPETAETILKDITIQVGRTGALTPNAKLEPVKLMGSVISNATLHNEDYIKMLDVRIGDRVCIQKAGDVIPAVTGVIREQRSDQQPYIFPKTCPSCGQEAIKNGAVIRCANNRCPAIIGRQIEHFVSRDAMNIDGMGEAVVAALIENKLVNNTADLYLLTEEMLEVLPGFGKKSAAKLVAAIDVSRQNPLYRLLFGLSIRHLGKNSAKQIAKALGSMEAVRAAEKDQLMEIPEIGGEISASVYEYMRDPEKIELIERLEDMGVNMGTEVHPTAEGDSLPLDGMSIVVTGTLPTLTRQQANEIIEKNGGKAANSVSKKTAYVLAGEQAGSKLEKAEKLGIPVIDEQEFMNMCATV